MALFTDVSGTTALAGDVKSGKVIYGADGSPLTGSLLWDWKGEDAELVKQVYASSVALKDTAYATWTPSTTALTAKASEAVDTFVADMANYSYLIHWRAFFQAAYADGTALKAAVDLEMAEIWQAIIRRPSSVANLEAGDFAGNACVTLYTAPLNIYYTTKGVRSYTYSISYGVYPLVTAAAFSSTTSLTPTVTVKTPAITARCNSIYFSTGMAAAIDQENSVFRLKGELYRAKLRSTMRCMYEGLVDLLQNPI